MGWLWGNSSPSNSNPDAQDKSQDPLKNLDPSLREFLRTESPVKYEAAAKPKDTEPSPPTSSSPANTTTTTETDTEPAVPPQSLYKDGRYAHLWKTYQPLEAVSAAGKSDSEKIQDIIEGYNYRKTQIARAALENCALEQGDVNDCFRSGSWSARMTMCRDENRKLNRCFTMQGKFLRALGYLSAYDRPPEVDEEIQMHADTLYHRMLDQEKQAEAAKAEGRPVPKFPPLITKSKSQDLPEPVMKPSQLSANAQEKFKKRLEGLSPEEREVEERAIKAEIMAGEQVAANLGDIYRKQDEERRQRQEQGGETISDKFFSMFRGR